MMQSPLVSVIIPVRNSGHYFQQCLDSVLGQTLRELEVIIVDDASTDGSGVVADTYAARDARVRVFHQQTSLGAGHARNKAMAVAKGVYIAFMDSDDVYPSADVLATLYQKTVEQQAEICGGSLCRIDATGKMLDQAIAGQFFLHEGWYSYQDYQYDGGFYRFLYSRKFLVEHNLQFPDLRRFQDALFFVKAMTAAARFYAYPAYTYAYRKNHKVLRWTYRKIKDHLDGLYELLHFSLSHRLYRLHYFMAKNLLDTVYLKMKFPMKFCFFRDILKLVTAIDWKVVHHENQKHKVKVSLGKVVRRYLF